MSDRYIEKTFVWLIALSVLLHLGVFALFVYLPEPKPKQPKEPVFIDLQQMPELKRQAQPQVAEQVERHSDMRSRVAKETAPRGDAAHDAGPRPQPQPMPPRPAQKPQQRSEPSPQTRPLMSQPAPRAPAQIAPGASVSSLLKPRATATAPGQQAQPKLFPSPDRLARLEENYRRRFENDIAEGNTRLLNSDDITFGSFLRRFEGAVYGVWTYPQEAAMRGIEGVTPVRITFNRQGQITNVQLLETSGSRILDEEVLRSLKLIGPMGTFPRGYDKDEFHLIAFFQYGGSRRSLR